MAIASVVPPLTPVLVELARTFLGQEPLVVEPGVRTGMPILYEPPGDVGADRIVNGVAAFAAYGGPVIVVDFGTATTFDVVTKKGEYVGGVICPGIGISADALFQRAARLPRVDIRNPGAVIGRSTVGSIQSGPLLRLRGDGARESSRASGPSSASRRGWWPRAVSPRRWPRTSRPSRPWIPSSP